MDVLAGTAITLWADFLTPTDDLVVPDEGSVSYTLHDGTGVRILGPEPLTPAAEATGVSIEISDVENELPVERLFDRRTVIVSWMSGGASGSLRLRYRVVPFPLYDVTPDTIRDIIGVASDELPDGSIDIFTGYLLAAQALLISDSRVVLDAALQAGDMRSITANRLVAFTVVQELLPSLSQRVLQSKTDGTLKSDRIRGLDLPALAAAIATRRLLDIDELKGVSGAQQTGPVFLVLTTPAIDPVTGGAPA